jgi:hypothetical protein
MSAAGRFLAHAFGDYVVQSNWMAQTKTSSSKIAALHAASYTACFLPFTKDPKRLAVIGGTHFVIDRWRLARYLVWAKNQLAPEEHRYQLKEAGLFGYGPNTPDWLAGWLLFIADNAVHLAINELALTSRSKQPM